MSEFEGIHAANTRAVGVTVDIPGAHAVDDADGFGFLPVFHHDLSLGWPSRTDDPFKLEAGVDIVIQTVSVRSQSV